MTGLAERPAGSPHVGEPAFLEVGKIRRPHGVSGEVLVEVFTDFPERLVRGKNLFVGASKDKLVIRSSRGHADGILLAFSGFDSPESIGQYRNQLLYVAGTDLPELPEGEYYYHELLDLSVVEESGRELGRIAEIIETGANDVYVVVDETGRELLIPVIPDVIRDLDLEARVVTVRLLPGLIGSEENG
jgi:16S rRNA processing protein RimM